MDKSQVIEILTKLIEKLKTVKPKNYDQNKIEYCAWPRAREELYPIDGDSRLWYFYCGNPLRKYIGDERFGYIFGSTPSIPLHAKYLGYRKPRYFGPKSAIGRIKRVIKDLEKGNNED